MGYSLGARRRRNSLYAKRRGYLFGFVLAALSVAFLGTETKGKNLEACSPDNPAACEPGSATV